MIAEPRHFEEVTREEFLKIAATFARPIHHDIHEALEFLLAEKDRFARVRSTKENWRKRQRYIHNCAAHKKTHVQTATSQDRCWIYVAIVPKPAKKSRRKPRRQA